MASDPDVKFLRKDLRGYGVATNLGFNEIIKGRIANGEKIHHMAFGQSPFPIYENAVQALKDHASENAYLPVAGEWAFSLRSGNREFPIADAATTGTFASSETQQLGFPSCPFPSFKANFFHILTSLRMVLLLLNTLQRAHVKHLMIYRKSSNKPPGAYLQKWIFRWGLIRRGGGAYSRGGGGGGRLFEGALIRGGGLISKFSIFLEGRRKMT